MAETRLVDAAAPDIVRLQGVLSDAQVQTLNALGQIGCLYERVDAGYTRVALNVTLTGNRTKYREVVVQLLHRSVRLAVLEDGRLSTERADVYRAADDDGEEED